MPTTAVGPVPCNVEAGVAKSHAPSPSSLVTMMRKTTRRTWVSAAVVLGETLICSLLINRPCREKKIVPMIPSTVQSKENMQYLCKLNTTGKRRGKVLHRELQSCIHKTSLLWALLRASFSNVLPMDYLQQAAWEWEVMDRLRVTSKAASTACVLPTWTCNDVYA